MATTAAQRKTSLSDHSSGESSKRNPYPSHPHHPAHGIPYPYPYHHHHHPHYPYDPYFATVPSPLTLFANSSDRYQQPSVSKWKAATDYRTGKTYYYHVETNQVSWMLPKDKQEPQDIREHQERVENTDEDESEPTLATAVSLQSQGTTFGEMHEEDGLKCLGAKKLAMRFVEKSEKPTAALVCRKADSWLSQGKHGEVCELYKTHLPELLTEREQARECPSRSQLEDEHFSDANRGRELLLLAFQTIADPNSDVTRAAWSRIKEHERLPKNDDYDDGSGKDADDAPQSQDVSVEANEGNEVEDGVSPDPDSDAVLAAWARINCHERIPTLSKSMNNEDGDDDGCGNDADNLPPSQDDSVKGNEGNEVEDDVSVSSSNVVAGTTPKQETSFNANEGHEDDVSVSSGDAGIDASPNMDAPVKTESGEEDDDVSVSTGNVGDVRNPNKVASVKTESVEEGDDVSVSSSNAGDDRDPNKDAPVKTESVEEDDDVSVSSADDDPDLCTSNDAPVETNDRQQKVDAFPSSDAWHQAETDMGTSPHDAAVLILSLRQAVLFRHPNPTTARRSIPTYRSVSGTELQGTSPPIHKTSNTRKSSRRVAPKSSELHDKENESQDAKKPKISRHSTPNSTVATSAQKPIVPRVSFSPALGDPGSSDDEVDQQEEGINGDSVFISPWHEISSEWDNKTGWDEKYELLLRFYTMHGHSNIHHHHGPNFHSWVKKTRQNLSKMKKAGTLRPVDMERIEKLDEVSFDWSRRQRRSSVVAKECMPPNWDGSVWNDQTSWGEKMDLLRKWHKKHGHFSVPEDGTRFYFWVRNSRRRLAEKRRLGNLNQHDQQHIAALEEMGYTWPKSTKAIPNSFKRSVTEQVDELDALQARQKKAKVNPKPSKPESKNPPKNDLPASTKKRKNKKLKSSQQVTRPLNAPQVDAKVKATADTIDPSFLSPIRADARSGNWDELSGGWDRLTKFETKFGLLREYYKVNGHTNVEHGCGKLYQWVVDNRKAYRRRKAEGKLPREKDLARYKRLEDIGFDWDPKQRHSVDGSDDTTD